MTRISSCIFLALSVFGCTSTKTYNFVGRVFDGSTGKQITGYSISMLYDASTTSKGVVDKTGRYSLEGLPAMQDFTVTITATGYRPFDSTNRGLNATGLSGAVVNAQGQSESLYFDAYLFPTTLQAPATTINVVVDDVGGPNGQAESAVSGTLHLTPSSASALLTSGTDPGAIGAPQAQAVSSSNAGQVWGNTDDIELASIDAPVAAGVATIAANTLIYGVTYNLDFYGDAGHVFSANNQQIVAGRQATATIVITPLTVPVLTVVSTDGVGGAPILGVTNPATQDGVLRIFFNQAVEFDPTFAVGSTLIAGTQLAALYPAGGPGGVTTNADTNANGNGLIVAISGNELSITVPAADLNLPTPQVPGEGITYNQLQTLIVRPVVKTTAASYVGTPVSSVNTPGNAAGPGPALGTTLTVFIALP